MVLFNEDITILVLTSNSRAFFPEFNTNSEQVLLI